jgi:hypothetical protein
MNATSNTWNRFLTPLESYINKPHLIRSLDAFGIDSDIFALVLFVELTDPWTLCQSHGASANHASMFRQYTVAAHELVMSGCT